MDIYNLANIIIPCITLGVSLFTPGVSVSCDRLFIGMLAMSAVTELLGWLYSDSNAFLYNIYMLLLFHGYFYLYYLLNRSSKKRWLLNAGLLTFFWLAELLYLNGIHQGYFFFTYVAGSLLLLLNVYVYITHRLNSPAVENIEHSRYFWISIGILVFYIPFLPVFLGVKYALIHILVFRGILLLLQILMHTSFIVGIRWGNRI